MKTTRKVLAIDSLVSLDSVNIRAAYNYDLPSIIQQIEDKGCITDPLSVEVRDDGMYVILRGNRRFRAAVEIRSNPACPQDLYKALGKLDCFVYSDLTEDERQDLIHDHGGFKPLSREDTVNAVWSLFAKCWPEKRIICQMYHTLARYAGSEDQLPQIEKLPKGPERDNALVAWQHSTMGSYLLKIPALGDYCKQQFLAWEKSKDGHESKYELKLTRPRVAALLKAKKEDGDKWHYATGGPAFNAKLAEFKKEDTEPKKPNTRPTAASLLEKVKMGIYRSPLTQAALRVSVGENQAADDLVRLDAQFNRVDTALNMVRRNLSAVKDETLRTFFVTLLGDSPLAQLETDFAPLLNGPVVREDNSPALATPADQDEPGEDNDKSDA